MSAPKRIPTDGGSEFGHNTFTGLSGEGLQADTARLPVESADLKPKRNRGRVDIIRQTAGLGGKTVTVVKNFSASACPKRSSWRNGGNAAREAP